MKNTKRNTSSKISDSYSYSEKNIIKQYLSNRFVLQDLKKSLSENKAYLLDLLLSLDGVIQSPKYHPESDALFHSLQVFDLAYQATKDPELWLAALFHDIGKVVDSKQHAEIGADMLSGILSPRIVWLIAHHLDLMISPRKTQQKLSNTQQLKDLSQLKHWDMSGRCPNATVRSAEAAFKLVCLALAE